MFRRAGYIARYDWNLGAYIEEGDAVVPMTNIQTLSPEVVRQIAENLDGITIEEYLRKSGWRYDPIREWWWCSYTPPRDPLEPTP